MNKHLLLVLLSLVPLCGMAQQTGGILNFSAPLIVNENYVKGKTTRLFGMYITDIYNLDSAEGTFSIEYRAWSLAPKGGTSSYMEFPHARRTKFTGGQLIEYHDSLWGQGHVSSTYHFDWDMADFPFDTQTLRIECENTIDKSIVEVVGDFKNSGIAPDAMQSGFLITDVRFFNEDRYTENNFANPLMEADEGCTFSTFVAEIAIERDSPWTLFLKIFSAVIVSFFIATITFVINPRHFDARLSLTIGALFAAVGSKFVVDSFVGISTELMLMDKIYIMTYAMIFLLAILLLVSHKIYQQADDRQANRILSRKFDLVAFLVMNLVYITSISAMVAAA